MRAQPTPEQKERRAAKRKERAKAKRNLLNAQARAWRKANPLTASQKTNRSAYRRAWYAKNRDRVLEDAKVYRNNNLGKIREYRVSPQNQRRYNATQKERYRSDEQRRIAAKERADKWIKENKDRRREIVARYSEKHRAKLSEKGKRWKSENRDKCKTHKHTRRALVKNSSGNHTTADWRAILKRYGHRCSWCGIKQSSKMRLTRDHYIALSEGGTNSASNIVPACLPCNSKKNRRDPVEFAQSLGLLL